MEKIKRTSILSELDSTFMTVNDNDHFSDLCRSLFDSSNSSSSSGGNSSHNSNNNNSSTSGAERTNVPSRRISFTDNAISVNVEDYHLLHDFSVNVGEEWTRGHRTSSLSVVVDEDEGFDNVSTPNNNDHNHSYHHNQFLPQTNLDDDPDDDNNDDHEPIRLDDFQALCQVPTFHPNKEIRFESKQSESTDLCLLSPIMLTNQVPFEDEDQQSSTTKANSTISPTYAANTGPLPTTTTTTTRIPSSNEVSSKTISLNHGPIPQRSNLGGGGSGGSSPGPGPVTVRKHRPLPSTFQPSSYSVIIGRAREHKEAVGNLRLRELARPYVSKYASAKLKIEKSMVVSDIISTIRSACRSSSESISSSYQHRPNQTSLPIMNPSTGDDDDNGAGGDVGAFIKFDKGRWWEVDEASAREKVGYVLRDLLTEQGFDATYRSTSKAKTAKRRKSTMDSSNHGTTNDILSSRPPRRSKSSPSPSSTSIDDTSTTVQVDATQTYFGVHTPNVSKKAQKQYPGLVELGWNGSPNVSSGDHYLLPSPNSGDRKDTRAQGERDASTMSKIDSSISYMPTVLSSGGTVSQHGRRRASLDDISPPLPPSIHLHAADNYDHDSIDQVASKHKENSKAGISEEAKSEDEMEKLLSSPFLKF